MPLTGEHTESPTLSCAGRVGLLIKEGSGQGLSSGRGSLCAQGYFRYLGGAV